MNKIIFKTKKIDKTFLSLYLALFIFLSGITFYTYLEKNDAKVFLPMGIIVGVILIMTIASNFCIQIIIKDNFLIVHLFFDIFKTDIRNITKIRKGETMWSGLHKYGTTTKGLIAFFKI